MGIPGKLYQSPQSIVLSEETALKIFGKTNVLGEFLKLELDTNSVLVKVTGILKKQTLPATVNPDILMPIKIRQNLETFKGFSEWRNIQSVTTYLVLNKNVDIRSLEKQLKIISDNGMTEMDRKVLNITFHVVPLSRTYYTKTVYPFLPKIDSENILIYSGIAILIMLLACINFIILTTAKSSIRNIEMGVRKVSSAANY